MVKPNKQIQALKNAAKDKRKNALEKVKNAIQEMKENNLPINVGTVAKLAGVSRTWIYNNPDLKNKIDRQHRHEDKIKRVVDLQKLVETRDKKIAHLKYRNQQQKIIIQLEVVYGELYKK